MKKILFFLILISIFSCSSKDDSIENIPDSSNDNCYNIISVANMEVQCDKSLAIELVSHKDFIKGGPFAHWQKTLVCIKNPDYTMNDFRLGQLICDYSIYQ